MRISGRRPSMQVACLGWVRFRKMCRVRELWPTKEVRRGGEVCQDDASGTGGMSEWQASAGAARTPAEAGTAGRAHKPDDCLLTTLPSLLKMTVMVAAPLALSNFQVSPPPLTGVEGRATPNWAAVPAAVSTSLLPLPRIFSTSARVMPSLIFSK